jgi:predicted membrane GTPase involved in stress response
MICVNVTREKQSNVRSSENDEKAKLSSNYFLFEEALRTFKR